MPYSHVASPLQVIGYADIDRPVVITGLSKAFMPTPYAAVALRSTPILSALLDTKQSRARAAANKDPTAVRTWLDRPWERHTALFR